MTEIPAWITIAVAAGTPGLAFIGSITGNWWTRRAADQTDVWRRREETMRMLRWAAEKAAASDAVTADMGVAALQALEASEMLQPPDRSLVRAVTDAVLGGTLEQVENADGVEEL